MRILTVLALLAVGLGACAQDAETPAPAEAPAPIERLAAGEVSAFLASHPDAVVVDVRTPAEIAQSGKVDGAVELDVNAPDFEGRASNVLVPTQPTVLYCRSGNRSQQAAERLRALGFSDLHNAGGFADLKAAGLPTAPQE